MLKVLLGNSVVTDGDFSSFKTLTVIEGPPPALRYYYVIHLNSSLEYRYVGFQRKANSIIDENFIEFAEVEVFDWRMKMLLITLVAQISVMWNITGKPHFSN